MEEDVIKLLVHIPSRGRPVQLINCIVRFRDAIHDKENTMIVATLDSDDINPLDTLWRDPSGNLEMLVGKHANKVEAINADLDIFPWDVLVCASDDLSPMTPGFDQAIRTDFSNEADDLDAVFWYPDSNQRICCHPVMGRRYYERDDYVFHPSYRGFYCDDELTMVAQKRGKLFQSTSMKWMHEHPNYATRKADETDKRAKAFMREDYHNFARRMSAGFPR